MFNLNSRITKNINHSRLEAGV